MRFVKGDHRVTSTNLPKMAHPTRQVAGKTLPFPVSCAFSILLNQANRLEMLSSPPASSAAAKIRLYGDNSVDT